MSKNFPGLLAIEAALGISNNSDDESASSTSAHSAMIKQAQWSFFFKPALLKFLSSSLFDIFDKCFPSRFLTDDNKLIPSFLQQTSTHYDDMFVQYACDIKDEVKHHLHTRTSKEHRDTILARLSFYFFQLGYLHCSIPFICSSMAVAVNKRLIERQHALCDVSGFSDYYYWELLRCSTFCCIASCFWLQSSTFC